MYHNCQKREEQGKCMHHNKTGKRTQNNSIFRHKMSSSGKILTTMMGRQWLPVFFVRISYYRQLLVFVRISNYITDNCLLVFFLSMVPRGDILCWNAGLFCLHALSACGDCTFFILFILFFTQSFSPAASPAPHKETSHHTCSSWGDTVVDGMLKYTKKLTHHICKHESDNMLLR